MRRRYPMRLFAFAVILLLAIWQQPAHGCSLQLSDEFHEGFVFYGVVVAHVESKFEEQAAWGIEVVPQYPFRVPGGRPGDPYDIYPMDLMPDCSQVPTRIGAGIAQQLPVGSVVGVVGRDAAPLGLPGDVATDPLGVLFTVPPGCDVAVLAGIVHDYRQRDVPCGNYRFEANKDIALLETASFSLRVETLERLAQYDLSLSYAALVAKYLPEAQGRPLLELRYPRMSDEECARLARSEPIAVDHARLWERCSQPAPYEAADRWRLYDAIRLGRIDEVRSFLAQGGDPNALLRGTPLGYVHPLAVAIRARREEIALALLRAGADFEGSGASFYSLTSAGMARVLDFLLEENPSRIEAELGLANACEHGHYEIFEVVLRQAAARSFDLGETLAATVAHCIGIAATDAARMLLERGVEPTDSMLFTAARWSQLGMVRSLLALGVDPRARYRDLGDPGGRYDGAAAIDFAWSEYAYKSPDAQRRAAYVLYELAVVGPPLRSGERLEGIAVSAVAELDRYAEPREKLVAAAGMGVYDVVEDITSSGALPREDLTAAARAALEARYPDVARLLVEHGADPGGGTLHLAIRTAQPGIVAYLLERGADPREAIDGQTPLEAWLERDDGYASADVFYRLADAGADVCGFLERAERDELRIDVALSLPPECAD